jgi:predicted DNA binding CopG/RHH family protein
MKDPFVPIDDYEKNLMSYTENEDFAPIAKEAELKEYFSKVAQETLKKDQRMNIRMTERDLKGLKALAIQEGIPYQTLASSILHKHVVQHLRKVQ